VGEISAAKLGKLRDSLERAAGHNTLVAESGFSIALVIFDTKSQTAVDALLSESGFSDIELPSGMTTPMEHMNRINSENEALKAGIGGMRKEMAEVSRENIRKVRTLILSLEVEAERAEVAERFASSKRAYVVEGWVLDGQMEALNGIIAKYDDALLEEVEFGHHETPPTVLDNPKIVGPMEFITKNYSLPNYFELDPTLAYFIALPVIYGMIVGDVIYGLISAGLALWFMKKFEKSYIMSNVSRIWLYSALPAAIFGVLFDEWGGMSHFHLLELIGRWLGTELLSAPLYTGFHRIENVLALVGLSALVGMIHLGLGFVFGAINEWGHHKKHAFAKIAWLGVEVGMLLALLPFMPGMLPELGKIDPNLTPIGVAVLAVSIVLLAATEGVLGIIEIPGLVGNILSYSRIAAIGIVGVVIAELLNEFIAPVPEQGIMALVLLPVFLVLHVLNCFVAMFESLVQGGRLNIVEFRSKFMHGGGDVFIPFSLYSRKL
jgi:V/A-type H+-transporting ATPase subunit I